jgi:beta-glucanase (GH16 family)
LPQGLGYWPALWMLGTNITSVGWPNCGEIDIVENKGSEPTNVQGTIHYGGSVTREYTLPEGSVTNFHNYLLEWTTNAILWYVDGLLYQIQSNWSSALGPYPAPFNRPFFLVMNVAIGGNYLGNPSSATINANTVFPGTMQVDYVRVFEQTEPLRISFAKTNNQILLKWPTNILARLQSTPAVGSNWVTVSSSTGHAIVEPTNNSALYRLISP